LETYVLSFWVSHTLLTDAGIARFFVDKYLIFKRFVNGLARI